METKKMKARGGEMITLDVSDEACLKFGYKSGTKVLLPDGSRWATIAGVAKSTDLEDNGRKVIWMLLDGEKGITYHGDANNLPAIGFRTEDEIKSNPNLKEYKRRSGETIFLDVSDEMCLLFGFKSGTRVTDPDGYKATLAGVAKGRGGCFSSDDEHDVMWYKRDKDDGVLYYSTSKDLKNEGFKEIK